MKYDMAFLSILIPKEIEDEVKSKSFKLMEDAAIAWQNHIIQGIEKNNEGVLKLINILPVHAYPNGYRDAFIKKTEFSHVDNANDINIGFCNVKIIKRIFRHKSVYREVKEWADNDNGEKKVLIAYTLFHEFTITLKRIKKKYPNIILLAIVVDLPKLIASSRNKVSFLAKIYEGWSAYQANQNIKYIDGFVAVTKQMAEILSKEKPYMVIEGISTQQFPQIKKENGKIRVIYAGLLLVKFGIMKLIDAFSMINDDGFQLLICGVGEAEDLIKERAKTDNRIQFLGQLKREKVLEIMASCNIIVNPRENVGEFTKYSFPSKNLEALSSGIPFIGYKLDGIPDEYDEYINYPKNETVEALAEEIYNVGKTNADEAIYRAKSAKQWVLKNKNCEKQGERIFALINQIEKK